MITGGFSYLQRGREQVQGEVRRIVRDVGEQRLDQGSGPLRMVPMVL